MSKHKHTDLPWYSMIAGSSEGKEYFEISGTNSIYWVAKVRYQFTGNSATEEELANGRANADIIVTAVNHHQELVTRLENLVNEFSKPEWEIWCDHSVGICACAAINVLDDAKQTLSKIK